MRREHGQALVPVLFVVMILTALAVTLTATTKRETRAAANHLHDAQQYLIAKGAVNFAAAELEQATGNGLTPPQLTQPPDTDANGWTLLGDGWYKLDIIDTASRLNINTVDAATLNKLPAFQNDPNLAPALIDWRDTDDNPTVAAQGGTGAESDYYPSLSTPYNAKNNPFDTVDELLLVRGFTPLILYGATGQPGTFTDNEPMLGGTISRAGKSRQGTGGTAGQTAAPVDLSGSTIPLSEILTTYSKEANYASDGTKRTNIRTANAQALRTMLTEAGVSAGQAQQVVTRFTQAAQGQTTTEQQQVTSLGDVLGKTNPSGIAPLVNAWPRAVLQMVADRITVQDDDFLNGRININTASAEVLATLPGMDQTLLSLIQSQQQNGGFTTVNDLFQGDVFTPAQLRVLFGRVCVKSSVYLLRVRVRMPGSPRVYAVQSLVELPAPTAATQGTTGAAGQTAAGAQAGAADQAATAQQVKILQWREVPRIPGWANWAPAPNYYGGAQPSTTGGLFGNP